MPTTLEGKLNADGTLDAEEALPVGSSRRVLITILDEEPAVRDDPDLVAWQRLSIKSVMEELEDGEDYSDWEPLEVVKARYRADRQTQKDD
ncbi:MAG: hypothetical protein AAGI46_12905 [Planctomycetota bacterium]